MKTWITYPAAIALGIAATLLLGEHVLLYEVVSATIPVLLSVSLVLFVPYVLVAFSAGISSLRRYGRVPMMFITTIFWSLLTTAVLSGGAAALFKLFPFELQNLALASSVDPLSVSLAGTSWTEILSSLTQGNLLALLTARESTLLTVMFLALLIGYSLKPDVEVIRPAYVVINSLSEALFRLAKFFAVFGAITIGFLAAQFALTTDFQGLFLENLPFFTYFGALVLLVILVILPLLYLIFTGFTKGNPYRILFGTFSASLAALLSANQLWATSILMPTARRNNFVQKRIAGTALPLYTVIGKGGSAMVATTLILTFIKVATNSVPSWKDVMIIAGIAAAFSYLSSFKFALGMPFIVMAALNALKINLGGLELLTIALLPLLGGISVLLDTLIASLGAAYTSRQVVKKVQVSYRELI